jgi:hypothetical protein
MGGICTSASGPAASGRTHTDFAVFCGHIYKGELKRGQPDGAGVYTWASEHDWVKFQRYTTYEGEFRKFQRHGHGVYLSADGSSYSGEWAHGRREGLGFECAADGTVLRVPFAPTAKRTRNLCMLVWSSHKDRTVITP